MRCLARFILLSAALAAMCLAAVPSWADRPPSPVVLADVVEREVKKGQTFVGTVEAVRRGEVDAQAGGYVEKLTVEAGDLVEEGAPIAHLRTRTLDLRIAAAQAERTLRAVTLKELESGSRAQTKAQARALVREAEADEKTATWKLGAVKKLRAQGKQSEEELRDALRAVATATARREALKAALDLVEEGPRAERIAQAAASVAVQDAEIARLEEEKERHTITAPYKGYVVKKHTEVGAWLSTGDAVIDLVALDEVDVVVPVLEDAVGNLRRGMAVTIAIDALPEPYVQGKIHRIVPVADPRSRTVPVKVRVKNVVQGEDVLIRPGMFARVWLAVGKPRKALLVPKDAVVLGGRSPVVYVHDAKGQTANPVPVQLGVSVDDLIEVTGALKAGMKVVVRGNERIFPGTKVRPVEPR